MHDRSVSRSICACVFNFLLLALLHSPATRCQSLLIDRGQHVARRGDAANGVASATIDYPDPAHLGDDGSLAYTARLSGSGISGANAEALIHRDIFGYTKVALRVGDSAPQLGTGVTIRSLDLRSYSSTDGALFGGKIAGTGVTNGNDYAWWFGDPQLPQLLLRSGDPAPGTGSRFSWADLSGAGSGNGLGRYAFKAKLTAGNVIPYVNDTALFTGAPGNLQVIRRLGDSLLGSVVVPGGDGWSQNPSINGLGQVFYSTCLSQTQGSQPATLHDDCAFWIWDPQSGNLPLIREGDPAPGTNGARFGEEQGNWAPRFNDDLTDDGIIALQTTLVEGDTVKGVNDQALYLAVPGAVSLLARGGDPAPGAPGEVFGGFGGVKINSKGTACFNATLAGLNESATPRAGLWMGTPGSLKLIIKPGNRIPGLGKITLFNVRESFDLNANDQLIFHGTLEGPGVVEGQNDQALLGYDPILGVHLLIRRGDLVEAIPGQLSAFNHAIMNLRMGDLDWFKADGRFTMALVTKTGTRTIVMARLGSLVSSHNAISAYQGGSCHFALEAGADRAGHAYHLFGSLSGTNPGLTHRGFTLPLNPDIYFDLSFLHPNSSVHQNTRSLLGVHGRGDAFLHVPAHPAFAGLLLHHAFATFTPSGELSMTSSAIPLLITP